MAELIHVLIVVVIVGLIVYLIERLPLPPPWSVIVQALVILIAIVFLLRLLGVSV
jgi:hypothetical protein